MSSSALKAAVTGQVDQPKKNIFTYLDDPRVKTGIAAVAGKFLTADRMLKLCVNAVKKTPRLLECDPQTVLGAMMASAALGLEPNTVQQQAFLIPYKKHVKIGNQWVDSYDCQFQVGARGFVTLAYRSPVIKTLFAEAVHEGDLFEHMQGSETFLRYAKAMKDRGELIGSFCHVRLASGEETMCLLPLDEVYKIRSKSETYRSLVRDIEFAENAKDKAKAEQKLAETPWVMWEDDMAAKSAIKKHAKQLPLATGDALSAAAALDSGGEAGGVDLKSLTEVEVVKGLVEDGIDAPKLKNNPTEALEVSGEAFGATARAAVEVDQETGEVPAPAQAQAPAPAARGRRAAPAPAPKAEPPAADADCIARINAAQSLTEAESIADEYEATVGRDAANSVRQATGLEPR